MSAKHALLGLLLDKSAYPYELGDRLTRRLGPSWAVNSGQLYQTVRRLEEDGLIERVVKQPTARQDRHVFAITNSGVQEFERWFAAATSTTRLARRPLIVKITLAGPDRLRDALEQIDDYESECASRLRELSRRRDAILEDGLRVRADHVLLRLNLSADVLQLEAELRWALLARETIAWLLTRDAVWPSAADRVHRPADAGPHRETARTELFGRMATRDRETRPAQVGRQQ